MNQNKPTITPKISKLSIRRRWGLGIGLCSTIAIGFFTFHKNNESFRVAGPMTHGHEDLKCSSCHRPLEGTARQQIQANLAFWLGKRDKPYGFGHQDVSNDDCLQCHDRVDERHPSYRFREPRFAEVRKQLSADQCLFCHLEHKGSAITLAQTNFCQHCHQDLAIKNDQTQPNHKSLVQSKQWGSCLRCHDFHGNHERAVPTRLADSIKLKDIDAYFKGKSPSPYGTDKKMKAPKEVSYEY